MSDLMTFPETWEEFERSYGFTDKDEVYTNGSRLIQSFRVKQWLEHMKTADAVEVVRCKDCKSGRPYKYTKEYVACEVDCEPIDRDSDFFCAAGKRRSE